MMQVILLEQIYEADMKKIFIVGILFFPTILCICRENKMTFIKKSSCEKKIIVKNSKNFPQDSVKAPKLLEMPGPIYPDKAMNEEIEGTVFLKILVSTKGTVEDIKILKSDNPLFNQSAVDAAKHAKFEPAISKGKPIKDWIIVPVSFELKTESQKLILLAALEMDEKRFKTAIEYLNKSISTGPKLAEAYGLRAKCFEEENQFESARLDYRRAIGLEAKGSNKQKKYQDDLNNMLKNWYDIMTEKIEGNLREIELDTNNVKKYLDVGKLYKSMELWERAEQWYDKYLERDNNASPDEIIRYTEILAKRGSIVKGEIILQKFTEHYPNDWRLLSRYGYFTLWLGKYEISKKAFESALKLKPFFKEAQDGLDIINRRPFGVK